MKNILFRLLCLAVCAVVLVSAFPVAVSTAAAEEKAVRRMMPDENGILRDAGTAVAGEAESVCADVDYVTRLGKPYDVHWDKYTPGQLWFTAGNPVNRPWTTYRFKLYKNGRLVGTRKTEVYTDEPDHRTYAMPMGELFEYEFTAGEYYVTVTAIAVDNKYDDGETAKSDVWKHIAPSGKYSRPTKPRWNWPVAIWSSNYEDGKADFEVEVYYSRGRTGKQRKIASAISTGSSWEIVHSTVKEYGSGYYSFRVRTYSWDIGKKGHSAWSAMSNAYYCSDGRKIPAPTAKVSWDADTGNIRISWNRISGAEKYRIYRATSAAGNYTLMKTTVTSCSFTDTTAKLGKTYYYKVRAFDTDDPSSQEANYSSYSDIVSAAPNLPRPEVSISRNGKGDPVVRWETVEGAAKYFIYRSTSESGAYTHVKSAVSARSYTDTSAKAGKVYYYKVKAVHRDMNFNSARSRAVYIRAK